MEPRLPPAAFEETRPVTTEDVKLLPSLSRVAAKVLESCVADHHVADVDYTDESGVRRHILLRPAYIRYNRAHHVVVWGIPAVGDHWIELRLDRIHGVHNTGEIFQPNW